MSAKARSRIAVQWLPVVLFLGFVAVSVLDTNATAASKIPVIANVAAGDAAAVPQPEAPRRSRSSSPRSQHRRRRSLPPSPRPSQRLPCARPSRL